MSSFGAVPGAWPHQTQFLGKKLVWFRVTASSCIWICPQTATLDKPDEIESGQAAMASSWRACGQCEGTNPSLHSPTVLDRRNATSFGVSRKRKDLSSGGPPSGLSVSLPYPVKASSDARGLFIAIASALCLFVSGPNSSCVPATTLSLGAMPGFCPKPSALDVYTWSHHHLTPATPEWALAAKQPLSLPITLWNPGPSESSPGWGCLVGADSHCFHWHGGSHKPLWSSIKNPGSFFSDSL